MILGLQVDDTLCDVSRPWVDWCIRQVGENKFDLDTFEQDAADQELNSDITEYFHGVDPSVDLYQFWQDPYLFQKHGFAIRASAVSALKELYGLGWNLVFISSYRAPFPAAASFRMLIEEEMSFIEDDDLTFIHTEKAWMFGPIMSAYVDSRNDRCREPMFECPVFRFNTPFAQQRSFEDFLIPFDNWQDVLELLRKR